VKQKRDVGGMCVLSSGMTSKFPIPFFGS